MSTYEKRPGTFTLFPNKDRDPGKNQSNSSGTLILEDGTEYFIDGWTKESGNGTRWVSGKIKRKQQQRTDAERVSAVRAGVNQHFGRGDDLDQDIPF